jgi:hypothetical protein
MISHSTHHCSVMVKVGSIPQRELMKLQKRVAT